MEVFAINEVVVQMEEDLACAKDTARLELLIALSWQLRQRDTRRALLLADEAQNLLADAALSEFQRQQMALRLMLVRTEAKLLFGDLQASKALAKTALQGFTEINDLLGCADARCLLGFIAVDEGAVATFRVEIPTMIATLADLDPVRLNAAHSAVTIVMAFSNVAAAKAYSAIHFPDGSNGQHPAAACWIEDCMAVIAQQSGDHVQSIQRWSKAYTMALACGQLRRARIISGNIGDAFNKLNEYQTALEWMQRGLELARQSGWTGMIGAAMTQTAEPLRLLKRFDAAAEMLNEGLSMMETLSGSRYYAIALQYLGDVELDRKQYTKALAAFQLLEQRAIVLNQTHHLSNALRGQAEALFQLGQPEAALCAAQAALTGAQSDVLLQISALQVIAHIHANHPLPPPPGMVAASTTLHYLQQALDLAATLKDYVIPGDLLDAVSQEYVQLGDWRQAAENGRLASIEHKRTYNREATNRALAMQVSHQTRQMEAKASHQRELASEAKRAQILQHNSDTLERLGAIGQEITAHLDTTLLCQVINRHVHHLLDVNIFGIALMDQDGMGLHSIYNVLDGKQQSTYHYAFTDPEFYVTRCVRERREFLIDQNPQVKEDRPHKFHTLSRLVSPLCIADKVLGVMTIQSRKRHAYGAREQMIFRTLCAYAAIAISNSLAHNDLASTYQNLKETQTKLVQSEKMASLGNLVAGIAHEINTPLGTALVAISGAENALQEMKTAIDDNRLSKSMLNASTAEALEYTDLALRTASRVADLVNLFKTVAAQGGNDQLIEVDLADYLPEVAALLREPLALRGCQLEMNVPTSLRLAIIPDALSQALACVFTNVFDHAFTNGRTGLLRLSAWTDHNGHDDQVIIEIEDNGHGIAPEHLPKVFDPFFTTQSGAGGHVGLGLYVAFNHITQRMKSDIRITSTLGKGTTVTLRLKTGTLTNHNI